MPSVKTRLAYQAAKQNVVQAALDQAASTVSDATNQLTSLSLGNLDLDAITIGGNRFVNNNGILEPVA